MKILDFWTRRKRRILTFVAVLYALWLVPPIIHTVRHLCPVRPDGVSSASALPAFSRKYEVSCSQCHTAYPLLNDFGRRFKMNGYVMGGDDTVMSSKDGSLRFEKLFPMGLVVRSRPYDNSRGSVANQGQQNGSSDGSAGDKMQPINNASFAVAGGDASKAVSWIGGFELSAADDFAPRVGDNIQLGYHPSPYYNLIFARKAFYALDPYQTISGMQQPMIANRAIDGLQPDQKGLSGTNLTEPTQTIAGYGSVEKNGIGSLFYMAGATAGIDDNKGKSRKNANFRLAYDTLKGVVIGGFGTFGRHQPATIPAVDGGNANASTPGAWVQFAKAGVDILVEAGDFVGRGAFLYSYDSDPSGVGAPLSGTKFRDRAAYAELAYVYKRGGNDAPFLMPMIRENWYTTFNGTRQFNYVSAQLAHYFRENVKGFVEYSIDTKTDVQGVAGSPRAPRGNRVTGQIEVGFWRACNWTALRRGRARSVRPLQEPRRELHGYRRMARRALGLPTSETFDKVAPACYKIGDAEPQSLGIFVRRPPGAHAVRHRFRLGRLPRSRRPGDGLSRLRLPGSYPLHERRRSRGRAGVGSLRRL